MTLRPSLRVALSSVLVAAACHDTSPVAPDAQLAPTLATAAAPSTAPSAADDDPVAAARDVPGFGGFYVDGGVPTVWLTDAREKPKAARALERWMRKYGHDPAALRVKQAAHAYRDLERWFERGGAEALGVEGAVFADLDEAANVLRVGVEHAGAVAAARAALARAGIPASAVVVEQTAPVRFAATLRDPQAAVPAGLQINFPGYVCTLGFNATVNGEASFVTNSHCTNVQGGVESTPYWQPLESVNPTSIATEVADPQYSATLPGCPRGRVCRYADASRARYTNGTGAVGQIARTTGANNGSLEIDAAAPTFTITGENAATSFTVGTTVNKVGRTTGWTRGAVTNTCVSTSVSQSKITLLCQTFVSAGVGGGDSGSPVFTESNGNATLVGLLWGGSGSTTFVFSPLSQVERELGDATVTVGGSTGGGGGGKGGGKPPKG
jgi:hypothetical protein